MQLLHESYFFDLYQDASGNLIDTLRQATYSPLVPAKTTDGCPAINGLFADSEDAALGGTVGHAYLWAQSACNSVTITEQTLAQEYDPNSGAATISAVTPGTPSICGQGGDGSCQIGSNSPLSLVTQSDLIVDQLRTKTTETVELNPFGDLVVKLVVQDDQGNLISSTDSVKYLQDTQTPGQ